MGVGLELLLEMGVTQLGPKACDVTHKAQGQQLQMIKRARSRESRLQTGATEMRINRRGAGLVGQEAAGHRHVNGVELIDEAGE